MIKNFNTNILNPIMETKSISKSFGHVNGLIDVDFEIFTSEVLALVGDNGAGKSTLIKILSGALEKDNGQILVDGQSVEIESVSDAQKYGISTVYQDLALVDVRDVASNIFLGREPLKMGIFINKEKMVDDSREVLNNLKIKIPSLDLNVGELSGGQRQSVAIARALARGERIFLLDEPTAAMGVEQCAQINALIKNLKEKNKSVVVITHNLEHIFEVADRIIIMRRGKRVATRFKKDTTKEEIVGLITGAYSGD